MILFVVFLLIGSSLTLLLHELSHALVAKLCKWEIRAFKPYPHYFNGRLVLGRTSVLIDPENTMMPLMHCSSLWKAFFFFLVWLSFGGFVHWSFFALAIWELLDYGWWWVGFLLKRKGSDGEKMRSWLKMATSSRR